VCCPACDSCMIQFVQNVCQIFYQYDT
jgi:hypothetical protein